MKTDKQRKSVKCYSFIGVLLIVIIVAAVLVGLGVVTLPSSCENESDGMAMVSARNAAESSDGINMGAATVTGYYLDITLDGVTSECYGLGNYSSTLSGWMPTLRRQLNPNYWSRADVYCTTIVQFRDVTYEDRPVFVSDIIMMNAPAGGLSGDNIDLKGNMHISIHEAYYNLLVKYGFPDGEERNTSVELMLLIGNDGAGLTPRGDSKVKGSDYFSVKCTVYSKDVPSDVNDPNSPNFELPGGSGVNQIPSIKEDDLSFWGWFNSLPKAIQYGAYVLIVLIVLALFVTLLRIIFGRK